MRMRVAWYVTCFGLAWCATCFVCDLLCNLFCVRVALQVALRVALCATCFGAMCCHDKTCLCLCATCLCGINPCQLAQAVYTCRRAPGQSAKPCPPHLRERHRERTRSKREEAVKAALES